MDSEETVDQDGGRDGGEWWLADHAWHCNYSVQWGAI